MPHIPNPKIKDAHEREIALDTSRSFIVQAPAGSGKTSLLVQRYLALLARVENPEAILAITFTKKAALEMRNRLLCAIERDRNILARDNELKWDLRNNSKRLKIQTIDAFCRTLAPFTPDNIVTDINAKNCYKMAAQNFIKRALESNEEHQISQYLETLLIHLDNDLQRVIKLFVEMLARRDQWLPHIVSAKNEIDLREKIEAGLANTIKENYEELNQAIPNAFKKELNLLLDYAANNLSSIFTREELMVNIMLTKDLSWRSKINTAQGFPSASSSKNKDEQIIMREMKRRLEELLNEFKQSDELLDILVAVAKLPPPQYTDAQWTLVAALLELLPHLAAELIVVFSEQNAADHAEISMAAERNLGNDFNPSDAALNMDYRIEHLLIDEFQDTSVSQYRLLEKLTAGWQNGDGRTMFLVGDPMQSIYRFREAEVGLFLRAQEQGINNLKLEPINLSTNFRSKKNIVDWVNNNFVNIFPKNGDIVSGAVKFSHSTSATVESEFVEKYISIITDGTEYSEANTVINQIKTLQKSYPHDSITILVKARTHLDSIIKLLHEQNIAFRAVELETLNQSTVITDLFALTRALTSLADRIAWLAILRAPWLGLQLNDLHQIAAGNATIYENLLIFEELDLSAAAKYRLRKFMPIITSSISELHRQDFSNLLESTWINLGGPACLTEDELEHPQVYFELLAEDDYPDINKIEQKIYELYAPILTTSANGLVEIMTIHKAKGLEFDHVIIPGIHRGKRNSEAKLLLWQERPRAHGSQSDLLLAPINAADGSDNPIYKYIKNCEDQKDQYESSRLLYVAATRAKKTLHLFGIMTENKTSSSSFLEILKPCVTPECYIENTFVESTENQTELKLERLTDDWQMPEISLPKFKTTQIANNTPRLSLLNSAEIVGTLIHWILAQLSQAELPNNSTVYINSQQDIWHNMLLELGINQDDLKENLFVISETIANTLTDPRGRWILDYKHAESKSEYPITTTDDKQNIIHLVIDRTFIDSDGTRWIIDIKNPHSIPKDDILSFLNKEQELYRPQLERYARAIAKIDLRPIRLALYFPRIMRFIEI